MILASIDEIASQNPFIISNIIAQFHLKDCSLHASSGCTDETCHVNIKSGFDCSCLFFFANIYNTVYSQLNSSFQTNIATSNQTIIINVSVPGNLNIVQKTNQTSQINTIALNNQGNQTMIANQIFDTFMLFIDSSQFSDPTSLDCIQTIKRFAATNNLLTIIQQITQDVIKSSIVSITNANTLIQVSISNSTFQSLNIDLNQESVIQMLSYFISSNSLDRLFSLIFEKENTSLVMILNQDCATLPPTTTRNDAYFWWILCFILLFLLINIIVFVLYKK